MGLLIQSVPVVVEGFITLAVLVHVLVVILTPRKRAKHPDEDFYLNPRTKERLLFPRLKDPESVSISIVFPCYNEETRLVRTMAETLEYLKSRRQKDSNFSYEIIIVDDGSKDRTTEVALGYSSQEDVDTVRVLTLTQNRGKGGAVIQGMLRSRGSLVMFADSDGATAIQDLAKLEAQIKKIDRDGYAFAVGSRAHLVNTDVVVKRAFIRNVLMRIFHLVVFILGVQNVQDTQCGFKMLTRKAAQIIIPNMHTEGWIFDIELFILANKLRVPIAEVGVNWREIEGSKLSLVKDSIFMLKDLFIIRYNYLFGIWAPKLTQN